MLLQQLKTQGVAFHEGPTFRDASERQGLILTLTLTLTLTLINPNPIFLDTSERQGPDQGKGYRSGRPYSPLQLERWFDSQGRVRDEVGSSFG